MYRDVFRYCFAGIKRRARLLNRACAPKKLDFVIRRQDQTPTDVGIGSGLYYIIEKRFSRHVKVELFMDKRSLHGIRLNLRGIENRNNR